MKLKENENILTSVLKSLPPTIQCKLNIGRFTIEVLPYLLKMISPELVLVKLVDLFANFSLTIQSIITNDTTHMYI